MCDPKFLSSRNKSLAIVKSMRTGSTLKSNGGPLFVWENRKMDPRNDVKTDIVRPAGPRGTAPTAAQSSNRYGPAPHILPAPETGGARRRGRWGFPRAVCGARVPGPG